MAKNEITVNVKANIEIDKDTAEVCLKMIQHYCNAKGITIIGERRDDGTTELHFEADYFCADGERRKENE